MKFTVVWKPQAERQLTSLWVQAADRNAVTAAADRIDQLLRDRPKMVGEGRSGVTRVLIVAPLAVQYDVIEDDQLVSVIDVRHLPSRPSRS